MLELKSIQNLNCNGNVIAKSNINKIKKKHIIEWINGLTVTKPYGDPW